MTDSMWHCLSAHVRQHLGSPVNIWCVMYGGAGSVSKLQFKRKARNPEIMLWGCRVARVGVVVGCGGLSN